MSGGWYGLAAVEDHFNPISATGHAISACRTALSEAEQDSSSDAVTRATDTCTQAAESIALLGAGTSSLASGAADSGAATITDTSEGGATDTAGATDAGSTDEGAPGCNSFTGDTPVTTGDATTEPISQIRVGDEVESTDPTTGATGPHKVTQITIHNETRSMTRIALIDGTTITATAQHPFWDATTGGWTDAGALKPGDRLREPDGVTIAVASATTRTQYVTTYDLTVDGAHTFYAGWTPVLVHNAGGCEPLPTQKSGSTTPLTTPQATSLARYPGYRPTNYLVRGERVFTNGNDYIVQDTTAHSGGTWKVGQSVAALGSKSTRSGTTDPLLTPTGD